MRKLFILCIGIFFAQQAAASSQCTLKAEDKMHCADCETLEEFAFYGASALYASRNHQQRSIQVTGNNGSDVYVAKGLAWHRANLTINLGRFGEWGIENVPYPSLMTTQVTAYDINHKVTGTLPNDGKFANGALNAKCKQIEKKAKEKEEQSNDASSDTGDFVPPIDMQLQMQAALRDMIRRGAFKGWHYRGEVFGPAEFLRPCDGYSGHSEGNDYVSRCHRG